MEEQKVSIRRSQTGKGLKPERNLQRLWNNGRCANMCVRRAKTQKGAEESPKETMAKKPPEATTDVNLHSQDAQRDSH